MVVRGSGGVVGVLGDVQARGPGAKKKNNGVDGGKDLHMFVWSSSASPVSEGGIHVFRGGDYGNELGGVAHQKDYDEFGRDDFSFGNRNVANGAEREGPVLSKLDSEQGCSKRNKARASSSCI